MLLTHHSSSSTCFPLTSLQVPRATIDFIGYSVRSARWRYTEWLGFNGTLLHGDFNRVVGTELYDHAGDDGSDHKWDDFENENVAADPANAGVVVAHRKLLLKGFAPPAPELLPVLTSAEN